MRHENYMFEEFSGEINSFEEQLQLNYEDDFINRLKASNHYNLELGELKDDLEYDFDSEYDENDWEEEDSNRNLAGEYDVNEEKPGSFEMIS